MAYYRTLKSGERRLIYTAHDRQRQQARKSLCRNVARDDVLLYPRNPRAVARVANTRAERDRLFAAEGFDREAIQRIAATLEIKIANARARLAATLKREAGLPISTESSASLLPRNTARYFIRGTLDRDLSLLKVYRCIYENHT